MAWVRADGGLERGLNANGARGLRLAAVSDGLPCSVAVMQAPDGRTEPVEYRVVLDRDLAAALPGLVDEGFVPRASARTTGTRHQVVFERTATRPPALDWQVVTFDKLDDLAAALAPVAAEGYRARLLVRVPFRSWPGLSEAGTVLAARDGRAAARASRVLVSTKRNLDDVEDAFAAAVADGWQLDLAFSSSRDGSATGRRERLVTVLSRGEDAGGGAPTPTPTRLERQSSFGILGSGRAIAATVYWNDYVSAWDPAPRRQIWASPIMLSAREASCVGIDLRLRFDGPGDQVHDIVGLVARPRSPDGYELVIVTEQRLGPG